MNLTPDQINGAKFEIWLQYALTRLGYANVMRNVIYRRGKDTRQVDVRYDVVRSGRVYTVMVEAKYTLNGTVPYALREGELHKGGQQMRVSNLVEEVIERQRFARAHYAVLATNRRFEERVRTEARRYGIQVLEQPQLQSVYANELRANGDVETAIRAVGVHNPRGLEEFIAKRNLISV